MQVQQVQVQFSEVQQRSGLLWTVRAAGERVIRGSGTGQNDLAQLSDAMRCAANAP